MKRSTALILILLFLVFCICSGTFAPLEFIIYMLAGWAMYLGRVVPQVEPNWPDIAVGIAAVGLFAVGVHWLGKWLPAPVGFVDEPERETGNHSGPTQWTAKSTAAVVALVVVMFAAGTAMIGAVHHGVWLVASEEPVFRSNGGAREAAERNGSLYNLRSLAVSNGAHVEKFAEFPAGCTTDDDGQLLHSWMTRLLPYIEEDFLYAQVDRAQRWDSEANQDVFRTQVSSFRSPAAEEHEDDRGYSLTHYSSNAQVIGGPHAVASAAVTDGLSQTVVFGEAYGNYKAWGNPTNWRDGRLGLATSPDGFGGRWKGDVSIVSFADGHSRLLSNDIDPAVFRALCTPGGGEDVDRDALD